MSDMLNGLRGLNGESRTVEVWWNGLPRRTWEHILPRHKSQPHICYAELTARDREIVDGRYLACLNVQKMDDRKATK